MLFEIEATIGSKLNIGFDFSSLVFFLFWFSFFWQINLEKDLASFAHRFLKA